MLGVCLGHQAIGEVFGAKLFQTEKVFHGVATKIDLTDKKEYLFKNLPENILAGRYHSWFVDKNLFPDSLKVTAVDGEGQIMALSHVKYDIKGVQFHPESVMTEYGEVIIKNG